MFWIGLVLMVVGAIGLIELFVYLSSKGNCEKCGTAFNWNENTTCGTNNKAKIDSTTWQRNKENNTVVKQERYKKYWENKCKNCGHTNVRECHFGVDYTPFEAVGEPISIQECPMCNGKCKHTIFDTRGTEKGFVACGFCQGEGWVAKDKVHGLFHNKLA